jgi:hypothetical protein
MWTGSGFYDSGLSIYSILYPALNKFLYLLPITGNQNHQCLIALAGFFHW